MAESTWTPMKNLVCRLNFTIITPCQNLQKAVKSLFLGFSFLHTRTYSLNWLFVYSIATLICHQNYKTCTWVKIAKWGKNGTSILCILFFAN